MVISESGGHRSESSQSTRGQWPPLLNEHGDPYLIFPGWEAETSLTSRILQYVSKIIAYTK